MNKSETVAELFKALAAAQSHIENATKNAKSHVNKYADLAAIIEATREHLTAQGLAVVQFPNFDGEYVHVETILTHASGEWISNSLPVPVQKRDAQGIGSAITYGRRYSLAALCNISQEDDDANASVGTGQPVSAVSRAPRKVVDNTASAPTPPPIQPVASIDVSDDEAIKMLQAFADSGDTKGKREFLNMLSDEQKIRINDARTAAQAAGAEA